jgi:dienelactone hydrolase
MQINKSCLVLVLSALFLAGVEPVQAQAPKLWGEVSPGSKRVGFKTFEIVDSSRTAAKGGGPRRLHVALWYPAKKDNAARMTFGEYVRLTGDGGPDNALAAFKQELTAQGNSAATIDELFAAPVYAVHDATPEQRNSNLLVIALGQFESPYNQAIFAEFYASQGFAVATIAPPTSVDGPPLPATPILDLVQTQVADLTFLIGALQTDKNINTKRVGIVGHAFGARAGLLLQKDPRVLAHLSINGDIGNSKAGDWMAASDFNFGHIKSPTMHVYETEDTVMVPDFKSIQRLANTDRVFVHMGGGFRYVDFTSIGNAKGAIAGLQYGPATPEVLTKIDAMNRLMFGWLLTQVSGDGSRFPSGLPKFIKIQRMTAGNAGFAS